MRILKILILICLISMSVSSMAQTPQGDATVLIDVEVVDEQGEGLPGATISVDGKPVAVVADLDGKVSLWVNKDAEVTISYLNMEKITMRANKPITGKIYMKADAQTLEQVVVTGYQRTTKRRTTGSVATIMAEELKGKPLANIDQLLQGKVAGMDVKALSGRPGEAAQVRIRGNNTITGNADPLWVVDGVPLQRDIPTISTSQVRAGDFSNIFANGISGINPNDIENITVLKDASAAAIYGSRAAGGVIVITTKRGKEGKMRVNYSANVSLTTSPPRNANLMNAKEKLDWEQELWNEFSQSRMEQGLTYPRIGIVGQIRSGYGKYAGLTKEQQDAEIARLGQHTTNWFEELFQNSVSNSHYLSLSGGSDKATYYVSMGYSGNKGLVKKTNYERYNIATKLDLNPTKRVKLGFSVDLSWQKSNGSSLSIDPFKYAYFANPYEQVYNEDGSYAADQTYYTFRSAHGLLDSSQPTNGFNIIREINNTSNVGKNFNVTSIANLTVNILENFNFEGLASYGYTTNNSDNFNGKDSYAAWSDRPFEKDLFQTSQRVYSNMTQSAASNNNFNLRGQLHYFNTFNQQHYLSTLLGAELRGQNAKSIFAKRYGYDPVSGNSAIPTYPEQRNISYADLASYAYLVDGLSGQSISEERFASFYFSLDYVLKNRYIASLTARTDGSSNFGSKEQFNPTSSLGLAWNVDQENFMQGLKPYISSLSVRTAFGYTGNINKSVYPQLVMDYSQFFRSGLIDNYRMGYLKNAPNDKLRWEKTKDMKLSVDLGMFDDRLRLGFEAYSRTTYDAVTSVRVPVSTGFSYQSYNTSTLSNKGLELSLYAQFLKTKNWRGSLSANVAYNQNKLVDYELVSSGLSDGKYIGYPLGSILSGKIIGIDPLTGIYAYQIRPDAVLETSSDYNYVDNYLYYLGTSNAPTNGGYSFSLSYKDFTFGLGGSFSIGGKVVNAVESPIDYTNLSAKVIEHVPGQRNDLYVNHLNVQRDVVNRWTPDNPRTDANPRIIDAYGDRLGLDYFMTTAEDITRASTLENVSYLKIGSVSLAYSLPLSAIRSLGLSSVSVSFIANNIYTFTNYSGIDPETPGAVYPMARSFSFGLSVGF